MTKQLPSHTCAIQSNFDDEEKHIALYLHSHVGSLYEMKSHSMLLFATDVDKLITLKSRKVFSTNSDPKTKANFLMNIFRSLVRLGTE